MGVWRFIQDQVLGMRWLNELIGMGLSMAGLDVEERLGRHGRALTGEKVAEVSLLVFHIF